MIAGGTINQRARNNKASLVSGSANQVITQAIPRMATAGPAINIDRWNREPRKYTFLP